MELCKFGVCTSLCTYFENYLPNHIYPKKKKSTIKTQIIIPSIQVREAICQLKQEDGSFC